jgi:cation:H+ antiporter
MDTVIQILILLASISLLIWGATKFIDGSIVISNALGVPKIVIGMTIVSLGTSAPEILVSINAALNDSTQLAVGNAIGSNIANVGLVLGVTACISKVSINASLLEKEIPILAIVSFLAGLCLYDNILGLGESTMLFLTFIPITLYLVSKYKFDTGKSVKKELGNLSFKHSELKSSFLWFFLGLVSIII